MERLIKEQFKGMNNIEVVESIMNNNNGYVTSKYLDAIGMHRMYLNIMQKNGLIEKVASGIYMDINKIEDSYYIFSLSMPNTIFSHMTALYFHGLSIKAPNDRYDITVRKNYNNVHLKNHEVFYVSDDIYELGLTEVETPMGNKVRAYDIERCICDIIKSKKRMDSELVKYSIKAFLKYKDKDLLKLSNYAEKMGIKEEVMNYIEVFYE